VTEEKRVSVKKVLLVVGFLAITSAASAQTGIATSYTLAINSPTANVSTTVIPAAGFVCNQAFTTLSNPDINPTHVEFNDPVNVSPQMACIYTDPGTGPLASLPNSATVYTGTLIATNAAGSSAASSPSPSFTHPGAIPGIPLGVSVR
jgi:hypothetical protein